MPAYALATFESVVPVVPGVRGAVSQVVVLRVLQSGCERAGVGAVLQRALVRVPVPCVDDERAEQEEDGDHERGDHDDLAVVAACALCESAAHEHAPDARFPAE